MRGVGRIYRETRSRASTKKTIKFINVTGGSSLLVWKKFAGFPPFTYTGQLTYTGQDRYRVIMFLILPTYCPADHVPDWQPRSILLARMLETRSVNVKNTHTSLIPPWEDQCEWHSMTRMTGPDCAVVGNLIKTHTHTPHQTHMTTAVPKPTTICGLMDTYYAK